MIQLINERWRPLDDCPKGLMIPTSIYAEERAFSDCEDFTFTGMEHFFIKMKKDGRVGEVMTYSKPEMVNGVVTKYPWRFVVPTRYAPTSSNRNFNDRWHLENIQKALVATKAAMERWEVDSLAIDLKAFTVEYMTTEQEDIVIDMIDDIFGDSKQDVEVWGVEVSARSYLIPLMDYKVIVDDEEEMVSATPQTDTLEAEIAEVMVAARSES